MNWLQRTIMAQQSIESIVMNVATGNADPNFALQQLQQLNAPTPECCNVIMSMYQLHPQGQTALDAMARQLRCQDVVEQPPMEVASPEMEKPMQMPSVEIE